MGVSGLIYRIMEKRNIMKLIKRYLVFVLICICSLLACSCNKSKDKDYIDLNNGESGITIKGKKVIYQIKEEFNKDYYDKDDIKKQVEDEVDEFVKAKGKDSAELEEFEVEDNSCHVVIEFAGMDKFCEYVNECEKPIEDFHIFKGKYGDIDREVFGEGENLIDAKIATKAEFEDDVPVNSKITAVDSDTKVLVLNKALKVKTEDDIKAVSMGVVVKDNIAATNGDMCYIVYK